MATVMHVCVFGPCALDISSFPLEFTSSETKQSIIGPLLIATTGRSFIETALHGFKGLSDDHGSRCLIFQRRIKVFAYITEEQPCL